MIKKDIKLKNGLNHVFICPVCNKKNCRAKLNSEKIPVIVEFTCQTCGKYKIKQTMLKGADMVPIIRKWVSEHWKGKEHLLSGYIRLINDTSTRKVELLSPDDIKKILENPLIPKDDAIERKIEYLLSALKRISGHFGKPIQSPDPKNDISLAFAQDTAEFAAILNVLKEQNLIETKASFSNEYWVMGDIIVTYEGWTYNPREEESNQGFIATWFDPEMTESIDAIEKAIINCGYTAMCIRDKDYPETIADKALGELRKSKFVIVNLTNLRPAVLHEAGFAEALGLPIIYVCNMSNKKYQTKVKKEAFYNKRYKIIFYSSAKELQKYLEDVISARVT